MSSENSKEDIIFCSLTNEETDMAIEIFELAEKLDTALIFDNSENDDAAWIENLKSLDLCIEDTLSKAVRNELAAIEKIENNLAQFQNSKL